MDQMKIVISGGGTGGHIFPAVAIANAIKKRYPDAQILFVGAEGRMEMTRVPAAGYEIIGLPVAGFDRKNLFKNIGVLWKLWKSLRKARKIVKDFKPDIAIGVGGYASGPLLKVASRHNIPTLLQEQNSYAGVTNKLLAKTASAICVAYEGMERFFPADRIILTGNPTRQSLIDSNPTREDAIEYFNLDPNLKTLLVIGGSLGARTINTSILKGMTDFGENIQVIWQAGELYYYDLKFDVEGRQDVNKNVHLHDFISRMDLAYKVADLVISRAGASSISELSLLAKPSILVPSPNVAEDHQTQNAMSLVNRDAAILIKDNDAENTLISKAVEVISDDALLKSLSENIYKLAQKDSANRIVDEVVRIIKESKK
ncbi:undecaprenyldiphospho-muramoylpentapeptide beta-N-acetylglucosaminyltransferase [Dysgonomonas sp. 520]|uniref:undecaprenyldiphospho-muramoylpentapeptide beta-N-acetylglucosaminyltransferase n=1 Tax=Dysgonomonas sp. 520 TaxID=2302931 RepID=UPI0013D6B402|nr:undecaprenyldiphospho-muramoylpentapeptide beta-N-acetylglucosaminyltransferase [Dysgonomonas sp. 520]NDW10869.1 undecaprenyldiphospho-muramoylpentapeptide beta-N-acetylglucosaminyltransferase [Dysgonomonas sp. 520]